MNADEALSAALMRQLAGKTTRRYAFAELHDLLARLGAGELARAVAAPPPASLAPCSPFLAVFARCQCFVTPLSAIAAAPLEDYDGES